ncbi:MAG TPA: hypothetical protein VKZ63_17335 [Kofleriaceae bacterium]|nr:hypothetical protein [Kofleriaceae bacterium]
MPPLEPAVRATDPRPFWLRHLAGLACFALGLASLIAAAVGVMQEDALFEATADLRIAVPLWIGAAGAAAASAVRREGSYGLAVAGVAMASAALALPWVLVLSAVAAGALLVIYVMSELF